MKMLAIYIDDESNIVNLVDCDCNIGMALRQCIQMAAHAGYAMTNNDVKHLEDFGKFELSQDAAGTLYVVSPQPPLEED